MKKIIIKADCVHFSIDEDFGDSCLNEEVIDIDCKDCKFYEKIWSMPPKFSKFKEKNKLLIYLMLYGY